MGTIVKCMTFELLNIVELNNSLNLSLKMVSLKTARKLVLE